ncbi:MAG: hypothetical protein K8R87_01910, partial [Verrucomicrobia bacterium]|nr:hypothetical protein [Verrucomicrobiota bacterium]
DGSITVSFTYTAVDAAGKESSPATVNMPFTAVSLSGNVYNDANGLIDYIVNGSGTNIGGTLYANLVSGGNVSQVVAIQNDGSYSFSTVVPNTSYTVVLSTTQGTVGNSAPTAALPSGWVNTGENLGSGAGNDGTINGSLAVNVVITSISNANFGIERPPTADDVIAGSQINPGGTVKLEVPALNGSDPEDASLTTFIIKTLPSNGTLYYNGSAVTANQTIASFNPSLLTVDPANGSITVSFTYSVVDAAGKESAPATVTLPFTALSITGNVYNDADGLTDFTINGTGTNISGVLYANLVSGGNVAQVVAVAADGSYSFGTVAPYTTYSVVLSTTQGTVGNPAPTAALPAGWVNTGEFVGGSAGDDGTANGRVTVNVVAVDVTSVNFGIEQPPTANNASAASQLNPGGTTKVTVPTLTGSDPEDASVTSFTIKTLPASGTLYYDGFAVTAGQTITSYDSTKLRVDPADGAVTISFTYAAVDAAEQESVPATVSMAVHGHRHQRQCLRRCQRSDGLHRQRQWHQYQRHALCQPYQRRQRRPGRRRGR